MRANSASALQVRDYRIEGSSSTPPVRLQVRDKLRINGCATISQNIAIGRRNVLVEGIQDVQ